MNGVKVNDIGNHKKMPPLPVFTDLGHLPCQIIMSEIVYAQVHEDAVDDRLRVDSAAIDVIARLGGYTSATIYDRFQMLTPKL